MKSLPSKSLNYLFTCSFLLILVKFGYASPYGNLYIKYNSLSQKWLLYEDDNFYRGYPKHSIHQFEKEFIDNVTSLHFMTDDVRAPEQMYKSLYNELKDLPNLKMVEVNRYFECEIPQEMVNLPYVSSIVISDYFDCALPVWLKEMKGLKSFELHYESYFGQDKGNYLINQNYRVIHSLGSLTELTLYGIRGKVNLKRRFEKLINLERLTVVGSHDLSITYDTTTILPNIRYLCTSIPLMTTNLHHSFPSLDSLELRNAVYLRDNKPNGISNVNFIGIDSLDYLALNMDSIRLMDFPRYIESFKPKSKYYVFEGGSFKRNSVIKNMNVDICKSDIGICAPWNKAFSKLFETDNFVKVPRIDTLMLVYQYFCYRGNIFNGKERNKDYEPLFFKNLNTVVVDWRETKEKYADIIEKEVKHISKLVVWNSSGLKRFGLDSIQVNSLNGVLATSSIDSLCFFGGLFLLDSNHLKFQNLKSVERLELDYDYKSGNYFCYQYSDSAVLSKINEYDKSSSTNGDYNKSSHSFRGSGVGGFGRALSGLSRIFRR